VALLLLLLHSIPSSYWVRLDPSRLVLVWEMALSYVLCKVEKRRGPQIRRL
jgi:hypothetical protein